MTTPLRMFTHLIIQLFALTVSIKFIHYLLLSFKPMKANHATDHNAQTPEYTVDYFIKKFNKIPGDQWGTHAYYNPNTKTRCAEGFCRKEITNGPDLHHCIPSQESRALILLFNSYNLNVHDINDGICNAYPQKSPKLRIMTALRDMKRLSKLVD